MFESTLNHQIAPIKTSPSQTGDPTGTLSELVPRKPDLVVPIRSLGENHRRRIGDHLKALSPDDRYLRFGFSANDEQIQRYVDGLNFELDEIFGIYNRWLELIAMAHLAYSVDKHTQSNSEFGVSVLKQARGRGYGGRLFERAVMHARNQGVKKMFVHVLSENIAMLSIARHAGATVERDGPESEAHLILPPGTLNTQLAEIVEEHMAQTNYRIKLQAKKFRDTMDLMQSVWRPPSQAAQPSK